ncbi:type III secretion apparatus protein, YscD/HrpQ family [Pseudomonas sp. 22 E 5]|uniref:Type III secretion protein D n=1 Tax=Pseudomonas salomonii TaxID=191391 RepID=A0A1H3BQC3_9PSED|nr:MULTISPECIES: FHA domain-containing protein [Pseudomonas]PIB40890.1 type III secretion protein [Pseudomonas sp. 2822-15]CRM41388.1 type III secretion apparatus protein, YscD/HrpQ family [Pseudomonas sp. 58 R 3]CRM83855.1 type III secretion apparatus protein, YscD/HrpQ family [Pseudomonas sp. 22 E 5]SDX44047.1 type III secretion protein D [Pseudomonas salomonii]
MFELRVLDGLHQGAALPLFGEQWSIGAHAEADLVLSDPGIAEQHALLRLVGSTWSVQAQAGLLQGEKGQVVAQITPLELGEQFGMGAIRLYVALADQPWPETPAPATSATVMAKEAPRTFKLSALGHAQQKRLISVVLVVAVIIMLAGIASTGERDPQASLMPAVPQKVELASPFEVRQQLLNMLSERDLIQRVSLQVINGQVALNGDVSEEDLALVTRMLGRFGEQFDSVVPVISRVRAHDNELPFKIVQIIGGANGHVVLEDGTRLFVGDQVDDLRLVMIDNSKVVFEGAQRYEVRW